MGAKGEADLRAVRQHFGQVTRALARLEAGRGVKDRDLTPLILGTLSPYLTDEVKAELQGPAIDDEDVRDILVHECFAPLVSGLVDTALEVSASSAQPLPGGMPAGMISVGDFSLLSATVELLVLWGIYPHVDPGVGLRVESRTEFKGARYPAKLLAWGLLGAEDQDQEQKQEQEERQEGQGAEEARPTTTRRRRRRSEAPSSPSVPAPRELLLCCGRVLESCMRLPQYGLFFTSRHGTDLLAAYLQLARGTQTTEEDSLGREAGNRLEAFLDRLTPSASLTMLRDLLSRGKEAPEWLRRECSGRMTSLLMRAGGVRAVLEAFLGKATAEAGHDEDVSHAHLRVAELLCSLPKGVTPAHYMASLAPQLPELLHAQGPQRPVLLKLAALVVGRLCEKMGNETRRMVLRPLLDALVRTPRRRPAEGQPAGAEVVVVSREEEVSCALVDLEALLFSTTPRPALLHQLANPGLVRALLRLYAFSCGAKSILAPRVEACLLELLNGSRVGGHVLLLDAYLHLRRKAATVFGPGGTGGAELRQARPEDDEEDLSPSRLLQSLSEEAGQSQVLGRLSQGAEVVVQVLSKASEESLLPGRLMERLLLSFLLIKVRRAEARALVLQACSDTGNADLRATAEGAEEAAGRPQEAAALLVLLEQVSSKLGMRVFGSGGQMIRCCRLLLLLIDKKQDDGMPPPELAEEEEEEEEEEDDVAELASVVLALLGVVLDMGEERRAEEEEAELRRLLPLLEALARRTDLPGLSEMAHNLQALILTRSLTLEERRQMRQRERQAAQAQPGSQLAGAAGGGGAASLEALERLLEDVQEDLQSPAPPRRARGVVSLTKVIHATPSSCLVQQEEGEGRGLVCALLSLLTAMLQDPESYVYLAAVQGLALLSERAPAQVIPHLVECLRGDGNPAAASVSTIQRLKAGEALVLSVRRCGEAMPKYAPLVVHAFILGARPPPATTTTDSGQAASGPPCSASSSSFELATFRASCLSNLAEVCGLLGWALQRYLHDVTDLALGVLRHEGGAQREHWREKEEDARLVRRGAVFLLSRMLAGTGPRLLSLLPRQLLPELSGALEAAAQHDHDPVTRFHAHRGLVVIEGLLQDQLIDAAAPPSTDETQWYQGPAIRDLTRRLEGGGATSMMTRVLIEEVDGAEAE